MKKFLTTLAVVLVTAGISIAVTYFFMNRSAGTPENQPKTANYTSFFGYSLDYPSSWTLYRYPSPEQGMTATLDIDYDPIKTYNEITYLLPEKSDFCDTSDIDQKCIPGSFSDSFELKVAENKNNLKLEDYYKLLTQSFDQNGLKKEQATIGGQPAIKFWVDCNLSEGLGCDVPTWIVVNKEHFYSIYYNLGARDEFEAIRSSIKFPSL